MESFGSRLILPMTKPIPTLVVSAAALCASAALDAQTLPPSAFLLDAVCFRGSEYRTAKTDVYVSVPYETLQFTEHNGTNVAEYTVTITVRDTAGRKLSDTTYRRTVTEDDYAVTRGKTGKSDNSVRRFTLRPASYRIEVVIRDVFGKRDHTSTRRLVVPLFEDRAEADISSILFVSDVEDRGSRFSIVPYVGDVIWSNELLLFAFVETYVRSAPKRCALGWVIKAQDGRELARGIGEPFENSKGAKQAFVPLSVPNRLTPGNYTLYVRLHPVGSDETPDTSTVMAERTRAYIVPRSTAGAVLSDLSKAIRQLIYIADQSDIEMIQSAPNDAERLTRFEDYWKRVDPTPSTVRNEALEDYYNRVDQANKRFKSYTEGWLTDMGRVYIIFGEPTNIDRFTAQNGVSTVVRWTYANSMVFTFDDANGFGDYRLRSPIPAGSKYVYRR